MPLAGGRGGGGGRRVPRRRAANGRAGDCEQHGRGQGGQARFLRYLRVLRGTGERDTLATGVAPWACGEPGATRGNRSAALPPELAVGVGNAKPDAAMVGSGVVLAAPGVADASTTTEADGAGSMARFAALPVTLRLTAIAVSETVTCACNSRCAELASTAPRSHAGVPLPAAQPKLKAAGPAPAVEVSWILTSGTLPPSVQAPTSHWAACPRSLPCCRGSTPTHKLTGVVAAPRNAVKTTGWLATSAAAELAVGQR